ncbi:MAG: hypothetical protein QOD81_2473 [Solirubrobacteraceae bacterium]|nr:hypothetical protein [Solirubrobacteraceae bacterium]
MAGYAWAMSEPDPRDARLTVSDSGSAVRVTVEGQLDLASADALRVALEQLRGHRRRTVLDLRDAAFADGRALRRLLPVAFAPRDERWDLTIDGMSESVRRVLRLTGLQP